MYKLEMSRWQANRLAEWLRKIISPPVFEDEEKTRLAAILNILLLVALLTSILFGTFMYATSVIPTTTLAIFGSIILAVLPARVILWNGHVRIAGLLFSLALWAILTFSAAGTQGIVSSPSIDTYLILIIGTGLFLGEKAGLVFVGLGYLSVLGLFTVDVTGILPPPLSTVSPARSLVFKALNFTLAGLLVRIANHNIQYAIRLARLHEEELTRKNRELEEVRSSLEQRVAFRTAEISQQKQFYEALFKNSPIAIVSLDLDHRIVSCNPAFENLFGYTQEEVTGQLLDDLVSTEQTREEAVEYTQRVGQGETLYITGQRSTKDGRLITVEIFGVPVVVEDRQIGVLGLYNDITERKKAEEYLRYLATHDSLTILPNRSFFYQRLSLALQLANWKHDQVAVMFLDLDGFKSVNDQFGHEQGDQLLQMVAERLHDYIRHSDFVARLGGDEFAFIFENIRVPEDAAVVAEKILKVISQPFYVQERQFSITASIGISLAPGDGKEPEILLKNADAAMYRAKELGKNRSRFFCSGQ